MGQTYSQAKAWVRAQNCAVFQVVQVAPYTMVRMACDREAAHSIECVGFSKCGPHDVWDSARGIEIAKGRAIAAIARTIMEEGEHRWIDNSPGFVTSKPEDMDKFASWIEPNTTTISGEQHDFVDDLGLTEREEK